MKKWNTPEVAELNIAETANGIFTCCFETCILWDKKESEKPGTSDTTTPIVPGGDSEQLS